MKLLKEPLIHFLLIDLLPFNEIEHRLGGRALKERLDQFLEGPPRYGLPVDQRPVALRALRCGNQLDIPFLLKVP